MATALDKAINTATDPGALFGIGNTLLNFGSAGVMGVAFNLASVATCWSLRARSEWRDQYTQNSESALQRLFDHRGTALAFGGAVQLGVAITALVTTGLSVGMAIPFVFGIGNIVAAADMEGPLLENLQHKLAKKSGPVVATILTTPGTWWSIGLTLTSGSLLSGIIFVGAGALAVVQAIRKTDPAYLSPVMKWLPSFINDKYTALFMVAGGNFLATALNAVTNPYIAVITALFGAAYLSIYAASEFGGVAGAVRTFVRKITRSQAPKI